MTTPKDQSIISVMLPTKMRDKLHVIAREEGRSLSGHVRYVIQQDMKRRKA